MLLESSMMLLENIKSSGVTHDDHHMTIVIQATGANVVSLLSLPLPTNQNKLAFS
jgi:hypothetical protein